MNKKDECEIVRDLALKFIERSINEGSENFVKKHLIECENCTDYYNKLEVQIYDKKSKENNDDDLIINQFKKVNKHINILKVSLLLVVTLIIIISLALFIRKQIFSNVVNRAYEKIEYMKTLDNYKLTVITIEKEMKSNKTRNHERVFYYKNGKYKEESEESIKFYEDNSYEKICVYHDLKVKEYYSDDYIEFTKGKLFNMFTEIINYKKLSSSIYSLAFSVREERYNGMECYVIRTGSKSSYKDVWIDKNSFITVRVVNESYDNYYSEDIYIFDKDVVNDEDVDSEILNSDQYKDYVRKDIINNTKERMEKLLNQVNNNIQR